MSAAAPRATVSAARPTPTTTTTTTTSVSPGAPTSSTATHLLAVAPTDNEPMDAIPAEGPVLESRVTEPQKHGDGMDAYVSYRVRTTTTLPELVTRGSEGPAEFTVSRRYRDFAWLHLTLVQSNDGVIVPPIPEKVALGRFHIDFIEHRRRELERFLSRVCRHPTLCHSAALKRFLSDPEALPSTKSKKEDLINVVRGLGRSWGRVRQSLAPQVPGEPVLDAASERMERTDAALMRMISAVETLVKRQRQMADCFDILGAAAEQMCSVTPPGALTNDLWRVGINCGRLNVLLQEQTNSEIAHFGNPLREHVRTIASFRTARLARAKAFHAWQAAQTKLDGLRKQLIKYMANPEKYSSERVVRKEQQIEAAAGAVVEGKNRFEFVTQTLISELERVEADRVTDMTQAVAALVHTKMLYTQRMRETWQAPSEDV